MSISTQTLQTLNAAFKVQYADKMKHLVPEMAPILSKVPFVKSNQKHGSVYIQPVVLSLDHGFTCHGPNDNNLMLNPPVGHIIQQANITASAYSGRSWISYGALSRASGGDQAFIDETGHIVEALSRGFSHMIEGIHWYGQSGIGATAATTANLAAKIVTIVAAKSAAFLWLGAEGMPVDLYDASTGAFAASTEVVAVRIGATTADGGSTYSEDGGITLTLASVTGLADSTSYNIYRKGFQGTEHAGLKKILSTDNIFGIDGARFGMWKSNRYTASAALSFSNLSLAIARSIGRGLSGPLMGFVNPKVFRQLMPDYVSLGELDGGASTDTKKSNAKSRRTDASPNLVHGTKSIKVIVDSVEVEIESTEFVKPEDAFFLDKAGLIRVGSTGPTFSLPGLEGMDYILPRPDASAGEIRIFADESPFIDSLNRNLIIQSISL